MPHYRHFDMHFGITLYRRFAPQEITDNFSCHAMQKLLFEAAVSIASFASDTFDF